MCRKVEMGGNSTTNIPMLEVDSKVPSPQPPLRRLTAVAAYQLSAHAQTHVRSSTHSPRPSTCWWRGLSVSIQPTRPPRMSSTTSSRSAFRGSLGSAP